jgi:hypothetical protein
VYHPAVCGTGNGSARSGSAGLEESSKKRKLRPSDLPKAPTAS